MITCTVIAGILSWSAAAPTTCRKLVPCVQSIPTIHSWPCGRWSRAGPSGTKAACIQRKRSAGKQADFIVLDRDLLTCPVDAIKDTRVLRTSTDGKLVYQAHPSRDR